MLLPKPSNLDVFSLFCGPFLAGPGFGDIGWQSCYSRSLTFDCTVNGRGSQVEKLSCDIPARFVTRRRRDMSRLVL